MIRYKYVPPVLIRKAFSQFIWSSSCNKVLMTFDDGPIPETTEKILSALKEYNIKAIFMCVGDNIRKYPELARLIISEGHAIGNHTFHHKRVTSLSKTSLRNELESFNRIMLEEFGYQVKYFRPPYGRFDFRTQGILKEYELTGVMWSLLTFDYKNNLNILKFAVQNYLKSDSIIVMHDSLKSQDIIAEAIKFIAGEVHRKGYEIGAPEECLS